VLLQEFTQRLHQGSLLSGQIEAFGQPGGQAVEAQQVGKHAPEAPVGEVGSLGKHGAQVRATPLQGAVGACSRPGTRHLH